MSVDARLVWLNRLLAHHAHRRRETPVAWCAHCDRVAEVSAVDADRCVVCAPPPDEQRRLAAEAGDRVRRAVRAGSGWARRSR